MIGNAETCPSFCQSSFGLSAEFADERLLGPPWKLGSGGLARVIARDPED